MEANAGEYIKNYLHLKRFPRISLHCKPAPVQYWEYEYGLFFQGLMPTICFVSMLELNWYQRFGDNKKKNENLLSCVHVVHITVKRAIPRRGKVKNCSKMYKNEKCMWKACKTTVFHPFVEYTNLWRSCGGTRRGYLSSPLGSLRCTSRR